MTNEAIGDLYLPLHLWQRSMGSFSSILFLRKILLQNYFLVEKTICSLRGELNTFRHNGWRIWSGSGSAGSGDAAGAAAASAATADESGHGAGLPAAGWMRGEAKPRNLWSGRGGGFFAIKSWSRWLRGISADEGGAGEAVRGSRQRRGAEDKLTVCLLFSHLPAFVCT